MYILLPSLDERASPTFHIHREIILVTVVNRKQIPRQDVLSLLAIIKLDTLQLNVGKIYKPKVVLTPDSNASKVPGSV
jgi:hypothetical protein